MKQVFIEKLSKKEQLNALNEIRILASIEHPNIIQFYVTMLFQEAFIDESSQCLCIVMENAEQGDLQKIIT